MTRNSHSAEGLLRSARTLIVRDGVRAATIAAIARESGAPVGSIYHRFDSLDQILATIWLQAMRGTHAPYASGACTDAAELALAHYDFCVNNREDVVLLEFLRARDVVNLTLDAKIQEEVAALNAETQTFMEEFADRTLGGRDRVRLDLLKLAVIDLPYGFVRPFLRANRIPPNERRDRLPAAVRAVLEGAAQLPA
jgi:AcrR family transcriptional regulator